MSGQLARHHVRPFHLKFNSCVRFLSINLFRVNGCVCVVCVLCVLWLSSFAQCSGFVMGFTVLP